MNRQDAYVYAVENEIKSVNLYTVLAKTFSDEDLIKTFNHLASLETIHKDKLIKTYKREFDNQPLIYDEDAMPRINVKRDLTDPANIIEYAIDREITMADQYEFMSKESDKDEIKSFFSSLAEEEKNHRDLLETELNRIQGLMVWFDNSELNGLMEDL